MGDKSAEFNKSPGKAWLDYVSIVNEPHTESVWFMKPNENKISHIWPNKQRLKSKPVL